MVAEIHSCEDIAMHVLSYATFQAQPLGVTTREGRRAASSPPTAVSPSQLEAQAR